jgi:hypothetical protein
VVNTTERGYVVNDDRLETIQVAQRLGIAQDLIIRGGGIGQQRCSEFFNRKRLSKTTADKIKAAVSQIAFIWEKHAPLKVFFDSPEELAEAYQLAKWLESSGTDKQISRLIFATQSPEVRAQK